MVLYAKLAALSLSLAAAGCSSNGSVAHTNASTTEQLNQISQNMSDDDGLSPAVPPSTPAEVGQSMRAGAAAPPRPN